jgi:hypothetical protein
MSNKKLIILVAALVLFAVVFLGCSSAGACQNASQTQLPAIINTSPPGQINQTIIANETNANAPPAVMNDLSAYLRTISGAVASPPVLTDTTVLALHTTRCPNPFNLAPTSSPPVFGKAMNTTAVSSDIAMKKADLWPDANSRDFRGYLDRLKWDDAAVAFSGLYGQINPQQQTAYSKSDSGDPVTSPPSNVVEYVVIGNVAYIGEGGYYTIPAKTNLAGVTV